MKGLRAHHLENMTKTDEPACGVKEGCPSNCSCTHINNIGNKIRGRNK